MDPSRKRYEVFVPDDFAHVSGPWVKGEFSQRAPIPFGARNGRHITLEESETYDEVKVERHVRRMSNFVDYDNDACRSSWLLVGESFERLVRHSQKLAREWCGKNGDNIRQSVALYEKDSKRKLVQFAGNFQDVATAQKLLALFADEARVVKRNDLAGQVGALEQQLNSLRNAKGSGSFDVGQFLQGFCALAPKELPKRRTDLELRRRSETDGNGLGRLSMLEVLVLLSVAALMVTPIVYWCYCCCCRSVSSTLPCESDSHVDGDETEKPLLPQYNHDSAVSVTQHASNAPVSVLPLGSQKEVPAPEHHEEREGPPSHPQPDQGPCESIGETV